MKKLKKCLLLSIIVALAVSAILIRTAGATTEKNQFYETTTGATSVSDTSFGQTFTPSMSGLIDKIEVYMVRNSGSTQATAKIYATDSNGVVTGNPLGTTDNTSVSSSLSWNSLTFTLTNRANITAGTMYALIITSGKGVTYSCQTSDSYAGGTRLTDTNVKGSGDMLFRMWMTAECTITFNSNGGSAVSAITQDYLTTVSAPTDPTRTGYSFSGWYSDSGLTNPYTFTTMTESLTLYAKWTVNSYTITFNSNGGSAVNAITQNYGTTISAPTSPIKTGYTFSGWYTDAGLTTAFPFTTMPAADITLYAKWTVNSYTISFNSNGGTAVTAITQNYGTTVSAPNSPTKTGYTFSGWYGELSLTTPYTFTTMPAGSITLYAKWTINSYTITFNSNGGTAVTAITQDYGTEVSAPAIPTKTDYSFSGWYSNAGLTSSYTFSTMPSGGITLYAKWTINSYTITFNSNGGSAVTAITQNYGTTVNAPTNPTKTGYSFSGWYSDSELTSSYTFSTMPSDGITLYAKWTVNQYTIVFDSYGGSFVDAITQDYGSTVTAPVPPIKAGHGFDGWFSDIGLITSYTFTTMPLGGITLYAKWIDITPRSIIYATNGSTGGTVPVDNTGYVPGATVTTKYNTGLLTKTGYGFSQWNTAPDGSGISYPVGTGTFTMGTSQVTLYPIYVKTEVTLKNKTLNGFTVNIKGWQTNFKYQIWNYSEITSDIFLAGTERKTNQWLLSKSYSLGMEGDIQTDGSLNYYIELFASPDDNYTISVRICNETSDYVGVIKDTLTDSEYIKIKKILIDGVYASGTITREIKSGASVAIEIIGNIASGTTYSAVVIESSQTLTAELGKPNLFIWDISSKNPRSYTLRLTATNNGIQDSINIDFFLYKTEGVTFASIDSMSIDLNTNLSLPRSLTLNPNYSNGYFYFSIGEPGRASFFKSNTYTNENSITQSMTGYGFFQIVGITNRTDIGPSRPYYDDGVIKFVNVPRSDGASSITFTSDVDISQPVNKGTAMTFTASASIAGIGDTPVMYSFWRNDANGSTIVKDWSSDNTLDWKPARVGEYTLQIRAKGEDALSYEVAKTVSVKVVDTTEKIAENVVISINSNYLNTNAQARKAVVIVANVSSVTDEDLLYKFSIYDEDMDTTVVTGYSTSPEYVWIPREAREYYITVYAKNRSSFGMFDANKSFKVTVN